MTLSVPQLKINTVDYKQFLLELEDVENLSYKWSDGACSESTLQGIIDSFEYTLPNPYVYVITDTSAKDDINEQNFIAANEDKQATVRCLHII